MRERRGSAGFTLLELLAVLALLAAAAAIAWPVPSSGGGAALREASAGLVRQLAAARGAAEAGGGVRCVDATSASPVCAGIDLPHGVVVAEGGGPIVRFHGDGSSSGGVVRLTAGTATRTIEIVAATGRIVQR